MTVCLLGLGANLGDPQLQLDDAVRRLAGHPGIAVRAVSRWRVTTPIGGPPGQPDFLNGAVLLDTRLTVFELLRQIQGIEQALGRRRGQRWDARPIDIDILLFGQTICRRRDLQVPHPWMPVRRFVLEPAAEIAAALRHPVLGWTVAADGPPRGDGRTAICLQRRRGAVAAVRTRRSDRSTSGWSTPWPATHPPRPTRLGPHSASS